MYPEPTLEERVDVLLRFAGWCLIRIAAVILSSYILVSMMGFQVRNPKANAMTTICHFTDVVQWHKLERFQ